MDDCISRQDAINALENIDCSDGIGISTVKCDVVEDVINAINTLPSAQPETHDKRTETHACDCIERQAAIDAISCDITVTGRQNAEVVSETIGAFVDRIKALPSAQPEIIRCKDCKYYMRPHGCGNIDGMATAQEDGHCSYAERREE